MEFFVGSKFARFFAKNQHTYLDMISKLEVTKKMSIKMFSKVNSMLSEKATHFEKNLSYFFTPLAPLPLLMSKNKVIFFQTLCPFQKTP